MGNHPPRVIPLPAVWLWALSIAVGAAAFALGHGFKTPPVEAATLKTMLLVCAGLFLLSRVAMLFPASTFPNRIMRFTLDVAFMALAAATYFIRPGQLMFILELAALYSILIGIWTMGRATVRGLTEGLAGGRAGAAARRIVLAALVIALVGGAVLALPVSWYGPHPWETDSEIYIVRRHVLNCAFTATAALTNTGLSVVDIGYEFSRFGQWVILGLMQLGGLGVLVLGATVGWRFRQALGWGTEGDGNTPAALRRLINFVVLATLVFEAAGTVALYPMFDAEVDANFAAARQRADETAPPQLIAMAIDHLPQQVREIDGARLFEALFHSVSAFCNGGLSLGREAMVPYRGAWQIYGVLLPLMILGSLGGPVLLEVLKRILFLAPRGPFGASRECWVTILGTLLLIGCGAALICGIESTRDDQMRYVSDESTRIQLEEDNPLVSPEMQQRIESQRLASMPVESRWINGFYLASAARGAAMRTVRVDEASLSPASRIVMMGLAFVGGGFGGTTGGLRIIIVLLLIGAMRSRIRATFVTSGTPEATGIHEIAIHPQPVATAAGLATVLIGLTGLTFLFLVYRESGSVDACLFESVNAVCNAGFTTGLTPMLTVQGKIAVAAAMLLGRALPWAILVGYLCLPHTRTEDEDERLAVRLQSTGTGYGKAPVVAIPQRVADQNSNQ